MIRSRTAVSRALSRAGLWATIAAASSAAAAWIGIGSAHPEASLLGAILVGALLSSPRALGLTPLLVPAVILAALGAVTLDVSPIVAGAGVLGAAIGGGPPRRRRLSWVRVATGGALAMIAVASALILSGSKLHPLDALQATALGALVGASASLSLAASLVPLARDIPSRARIALALPGPLRARPMRAARLAHAVPAEGDDDAATLARHALAIATEMHRLDRAMALLNPDGTAELGGLRREADRGLDHVLRALELAAATASAEQCRALAREGGAARASLTQIQARLAERAERARAWAEVSQTR